MFSSKCTAVANAKPVQRLAENPLKVLGHEIYGG
jgi:hypothetical protein